MDANFWLDRWREGRTGFHQDTVMPLLQKHWPSLPLAEDSRVLVPLCGKSLDMIWLAAQGHRVLGVELSPLAVEQFFDENRLRPEVRESPLGRHHAAGNIEILCGDIFGLDAATLTTCDAVYDRAALIALPRDMRPGYVQHIYAQLPARYRGLLITLDYVQELMDGPPFSVDDAEVQSLFAPHSRATIVERRDILAAEPRFRQRGLERLDTLVYALGKASG